MTSRATLRVRVDHRDALIAAGACSVLADQSDLRVTQGAADVTGANAATGVFGSPEIVVADYETGLRYLEGGRTTGASVVILTSIDSEAGVCRALQMGVRGYLLLDCSAGEFVDALRRVSGGEVALSASVASHIGHTMARRPLTQREIEILGQLMLGLSNKVIAARLSVSVGTVKTHLKSVLQKLDAKSRTGAVAVAHRRGIIHVSGAGNWIPGSVPG